jgi:phenylacetate-CoA ligase
MLIHAFETVDFYRKRFLDAGFDPYKFNSLHQLRTLPLLTKIDIVEHSAELISKHYKSQNLISSCTGGSTGTQLHFCINKESVDEKNACAWRHNRWANWDLGMPVAALWGNPKKPGSLKAKLRQKFLNRFTYLDTMNMTFNTMNEFAYKINKLGNYILFGHSHSLSLFAEFLRSQAIHITSPIGIVSTSMMLMTHERSLIEDVFRQKVTDRYGCEEVGLIGSECEIHSGMHLNVDHLVIEFIKADGTCALPGEEGRIIVTDLTNYGMPFIRYEVGDVGVPSDQVCRCGRGLPVMERIVGRTADFLVRNDGSLVAGVSLIERLLTKISSIHQMQIVQNQKDSLLLRIVKGKNFSEVETVGSLRQEFEKVFPGTSMQIDFTDSIPQETSGKYRFAICNVR